MSTPQIALMVAQEARRTSVAREPSTLDHSSRTRSRTGHGTPTVDGRFARLLDRNRDVPGPAI
jgi:hypothetical protein